MAGETYLYPTDAQIPIRAKEPDAPIVLKPYLASRDRVAAAECKASYAALNYSAVLAPISLAEQRRLDVHGRIGYERAEALIGEPQGRQSQAFIDMFAYLQRHDYRLNAMDAEEKVANLARLKPRIELCDKALAAWGAPQIDEEAVQDYVAKEFERFEHNRNTGATLLPTAKSSEPT